MQTKQATTKKYDLVLKASKLSKIELNNLIDVCLDEKNYEDAKIFADIYLRRSV